MEKSFLNFKVSCSYSPLIRFRLLTERQFNFHSPNACSVFLRLSYLQPTGPLESTLNLPPPYRITVRSMVLGLRTLCDSTYFLTSPP